MAGSWLHRGNEAIASLGIVRVDMLQSGTQGAGEAVFDRCLAPALPARAIMSSALLGSLL